MIWDLVVIGGGAAGYFAAINLAAKVPNSRIIILEKGKGTLEKVRISGGGRCNVTHGCFDPKELTTFYPRGQKELRGPFHKFMTGDMMAWLDERGVETKIEDDGRAFPTTDSSETIIECFESERQRLGIKLNTSCGVRGLSRQDETWNIETDDHIFKTKNVLVATGSSPVFWKVLGKLGIDIVPPVPSLFTFKIEDPLLKDLMGVSVPFATVHLPSRISESGPLLITHWGLSGPAVLKLSSRGARELAEVKHHFKTTVQWTSDSFEDVNEWIKEQRNQHGKKRPITTPYPEIPKRLWERMLKLCGLEQGNWADQSKEQLQKLASTLSSNTFDVKGKSTFKEEFVTAGGVDLKQIDFRTMEHKSLPGLYFAGEVLNIDAVTGGFNFQACWTGGHIVSEALASNLTSI